MNPKKQLLKDNNLKASFVTASFFMNRVIFLAAFKKFEIYKSVSSLFFSILHQASGCVDLKGLRSRAKKSLFLSFIFLTGFFQDAVTKLCSLEDHFRSQDKEFCILSACSSNFKLSSTQDILIK